MTSRTDPHASHGTTAKRRAGPSRRSGFGGTLLGVFVGVALGLALAAGVAIAGGRFSDDCGDRQFTRRQPGKYGCNGGHTTGAGAWQHRWH